MPIALLCSLLAQQCHNPGCPNDPFEVGGLETEACVPGASSKVNAVVPLPTPSHLLLSPALLISPLFSPSPPHFLLNPSSPTHPPAPAPFCCVPCWTLSAQHWVELTFISWSSPCPSCEGHNLLPAFPTISPPPEGPPPLTSSISSLPTKAMEQIPGAARLKSMELHQFPSTET